MWNDCQGALGKLRVNLIIWELFLEIFLRDYIYSTLEGVVVNCIQDID